jgi:hypothetical protein
MRTLFGIGKPRRAQDGLAAAFSRLFAAMAAWLGTLRRTWRRSGNFPSSPAPNHPLPLAA